MTLEPAGGKLVSFTEVLVGRFFLLVDTAKLAVLMFPVVN